MADEQPATSAPLFRANKRRKLHPKPSRREDDDDNSTVAIETEGGTPVPAKEDDDGSETPQGVVRPASRPKRRGANTFTNTTSRRKEDDTVEERAIVLATHQQETPPPIPGSDRFVKPMGKVTVEDKHMMAFIDSKLGRQSATSSTTTTSNDHPRPSANILSSNNHYSPHRSTNTKASGNESHRAAAQGKVEEVDVPASRSSHHPRSQPKNLNLAQLQPTPRSNANTRKRNRRQPAAPDPTALARAGLIEQIMSEGRDAQNPAYSTTHTSAAGASGASSGFAPETDEQVAAAFEAEFMADLEERNRQRRQPAMPKEKGVVDEKHGPKLGGSRQQRERYKGWEATQKKAGK